MSKRVVWIIGGSGGIGSAIAYLFAARGFDVAVGYFSARETAENIARSCREQYVVTAEAIGVDIRDPCSVQKAYDHVVDRVGQPSVLVYAAGKTRAILLQECTECDLNEMIDIHIKGAVYTIQACLPFLLREKYGRIVVLSSIWGEVGGAYEVLYSTAKGAQNALTKSLAKELAPSGITVNAVSPGAIQTNMLVEQLTIEEQNDLRDDIPLGRIGAASEVASLVCYLSSEEASYITGQVIRISGGWDG